MDDQMDSDQRTVRTEKHGLQTVPVPFTSKVVGSGRLEASN